MRLLTNVSKFLILTVFGWSLLITWNGNNVNINDFDFGYKYTETVEKAQTADSIWKTISSEFKLDHQAQSTRVKAEIRKLLSDQESFHQILSAAAPYIYYIQQQTHARGLPAEIALIPFVESEFNPNDRSKKGATGLWQLMAGTAHELGVKIRTGYDGRRNVIVSTKAALAYFKDLGVFFNGNWYLAIAAYNCGQGKIQSAMRRTGSKSYWNLPLPLETKLYVPKLLAVAEIIENPSKYGVKLPLVNNKPYFTEVKAEKSVNLSQVAKSSGISMETLNKLNPDYNKQKVVAKENTLLVPITKVSSVKATVHA